MHFELAHSLPRMDGEYPLHMYKCILRSRGWLGIRPLRHFDHNECQNNKGAAGACSRLSPRVPLNLCSYIPHPIPLHNVWKLHSTRPRVAFKASC